MEQWDKGFYITGGGAAVPWGRCLGGGGAVGVSGGAQAGKCRFEAGWPPPPLCWAHIRPVVAVHRKHWHHTRTYSWMRINPASPCVSVRLLAPPLAAIAGSTNMSSLVVMSKGTKFTQQSYKVSGEQGAVSRGRSDWQLFRDDVRGASQPPSQLEAALSATPAHACLPSPPDPSSLCTACSPHPPAPLRTCLPLGAPACLLCPPCRLLPL